MRLLLSALAAVTLAAPAAAEPRVVATLQPVALIAEALMGRPPVTLSDGGAGHEHGGSLRPSDARALADADLVLWIGAALEPGVAAALSNGAASLALGDIDGLTARAGPGGVPDPHVWLDPANVDLMADRMMAALSSLDPPAADPAVLDEAMRGLADELLEAENAIAARMAPLANRPYAVEHDAFRHFADAFGLAEPLALGEAVGARSLRAARATVAERGITCLIVEPGEPSRLAVALGEGVRAVAIDPLGRDASGPVDLIERVAAGFEECLGDGTGG